MKWTFKNRSKNPNHFETPLFAERLILVPALLWRIITYHIQSTQVQSVITNDGRRPHMANSFDST